MDWIEEYLWRSSRSERRHLIIETTLWALLPLGISLLAYVVWVTT